jgi:chromosome segregation ATPase
LLRNEEARLESDGIHLDSLHLKLQAELVEKKRLAAELFAETEARQFDKIDADGLEEKIDQLDKKIASLQADKSKLAEEKSVLEEEKFRLEEEKIRLEFEKTQLEVAKDRLVDFKTRLEDENTTLEDAKIRLEVEKSMLEEEQTKLKEEKLKLEDEHEKLIKKSAVPVPILRRYTTCDCDDCDTLIASRPSTCSSAEILQLVEARAKSLVKVDLEHCKNVKVANAAFFSSGLACLGAASGLVGYWFIKLKPLIAVAAAAA